MPKSRVEFWKPKLATNRERDLANQEKLTEMGWYFLIVWECELADKVELTSKFQAFLGDAHQ